MPQFWNPLFEKIKFKKIKILYFLYSIHLNPEELFANIKLFIEYLDIFHIGGNIFSFTDKVKDDIKTSNEILVYTQSCRYPEIHIEEFREPVQSILN